MATKKQELVVFKNKKLAINDECDIKFEAKLNHKDIIDAVIFNKEEELLQEQKRLVELQRNTREQKYAEDLDKKLTQFAKSYKNKNVVNLCDQFNKLLSEKNRFNKINYEWTGDIYYDSEIENKKLDLNVRFKISDCRYSQIEFKIQIDLPNTLVAARNLQVKYDNELKKIERDLTIINNKLKEVPRWKKQINANLVSKLFTEGISRANMISVLREELDKVVGY